MEVFRKWKIWQGFGRSMEVRHSGDRGLGMWGNGHTGARTSSKGLICNVGWVLSKRRKPH